MFIKSVTIKNFRSILNQKFDLSSLNVLVGNNDIGKSNFLKALNLFFNNETEVGVPFNFKNDFCSFATTPRKKAPEILVEIEFIAPTSFREDRPIVWRKRWRSDSQPREDRYYADGNEIETRKKIGFWMDQIRYSYVPAIKGQEYFSKLLADLHDVLSSTIESELKEASEGFINRIRDHTKNISRDLAQRLGFSSSLQIPSDLRVLFRVLDFETGIAERNVSLKYRGDGIKVRHIPIILKFIGEQRNAKRAKGAVKSSSIWGYEEPENNLELSRAFEHAKELVEYSKSVQILITTHSPAFYSIKGLTEVNTKVFVVKPSDTISYSSVISEFDHTDIGALNSDMGLLPFITPHIKSLLSEKEELLIRVQKREKELENVHSNVLFVEGHSDKVFIDAALKLFTRELPEKVIIKAGGGTQWVSDMLISWFFARKQQYAVGLFDKDDAGRLARNRVEEVAKSSRSKNYKIISIQKAPHINEIQQKLKIPVLIEDLFHHTALAHAKKRGWLEFKTEVKIDLDPETSLLDYCQHVLRLSEDQLLYLYKVKIFHKNDFSNYVTSLSIEEKLKVFHNFKYLLDDIDSAFTGFNKPPDGLQIP